MKKAINAGRESNLEEVNGEYYFIKIRQASPFNGLLAMLGQVFIGR